MRRLPPLWSRVLCGLGFSFFLGACEVDYYAHLARGQARIVLHCQSIEDLLQHPALPAPRREQFALVEEIRTYALQLGLEQSDSYTCFYDTGGEPVSWNISASPPDRLESYQWRFPFVGALPYKGFFARDRAEAERSRLQAEGFDTLLRPVSAYSTLGFFADPVLSTMLDYAPERLADLILHELTHATVFVRGHADFNESLATFVGQTGSLDFLAQRFGADSPLIEKAKADRRDAALFRDFMTATVASLDSLYQSGLPRDRVLLEREQLFALAKERYQEIRPRFEGPPYDGFLSWEINNARLLSYRRYHDLADFESVHLATGSDLKRTLQICKSCERADDPRACLLQALPPSL